MISNQIFEKISNLHSQQTYNALKQQVYYDLNRTMQNAKANVKFVEVSRASPITLIQVNKELLENGFFSMVLEKNGEVVLRLYVREN